MAKSHSDIQILAEQDDLLAVNKPAGLLSIAGREPEEDDLRRILEQRYERIFTVHRLDRQTSGVMLFARTGEAHRYYSGIFERHETEKYYLGLVLGKPASSRGTVEAPIAAHRSRPGLMVVHPRGKPARTDFEVLNTWGRFSWLRFRIHTGRTHQIRLHMKYLGHPIICDDTYGDGQPLFLKVIKHGYKPSSREGERPLLGRLGLHAERLVFTDFAGNARDIRADLPKDLRATLQQLQKWSR